MAKPQRDNKGRFVKGYTPDTCFRRGQVGPNKGKKFSEETRLKMSIAKKGKAIPHLHNEEVWQKIGDANRGERSACWMGGITPESERIRHSSKSRKWRKEILSRDNACVLCGECDKSLLEVDHIKPFSAHPELRFDLDNGRVLCKPCHRMTDSYGGRQTHKNKLVWQT